MPQDWNYGTDRMALQAGHSVGLERDLSEMACYNNYLEVSEMCVDDYDKSLTALAKGGLPQVWDANSSESCI
jgi:hypothetical protein